jgi:hypothetical protein
MKRSASLFQSYAIQGLYVQENVEVNNDETCVMQDKFDQRQMSFKSLWERYSEISRTGTRSGAKLKMVFIYFVNEKEKERLKGKRKL